MANLTDYIKESLKHVISTGEKIEEVNFDLGVGVKKIDRGDPYSVYVDEGSSNRISFTIKISSKED